MKTPLLIIGAGNVGGFLAYNIEEFKGDFDIIGFLDDDQSKIGSIICEKEVLGPVSDIFRFRGKKISVAIGIAKPSAKRLIAQKTAGYDFKFPSFISRNVWLSKHVKIGFGVIVYPGVSINYETEVGNFVIINLNCAIGHNSTICNYSTLAPGVNFAGFTYVEEGVDIGIGTSTRQNVRIGANSLIGGQTMLLKDVHAGSCVVGVPGKNIR